MCKKSVFAKLFGDNRVCVFGRTASVVRLFIIRIINTVLGTAPEFQLQELFGVIKIKKIISIVLDCVVNTRAMPSCKKSISKNCY